ncbi:hypothetical protein Hanom_Chr10g00878461 [Helianthus anomalus]
MKYQTQTNTFTNINERTQPLFMSAYLTTRTKYLVRVRSFIKCTNTNELPTERFPNCSLNVRFVCSPIWIIWNGSTVVYLCHNYLVCYCFKVIERVKITGHV